MPHIALTQDRAKRLRPAERETVYWDDKMPGFGLRVSPKGRKTFFVQYRVRGAEGSSWKERQETLGTLDFLTVEEARIRALRSKAKAAEGGDPVTERGAEAKAEEAEGQPREFTFAKFVDRYFTEYVTRNQRSSSASEVKRRLNRWCKAWADRPLRDIKKSHVLDFLNKLRLGRRGTTGLVEANHLLISLRQALKWAQQHDLIDTNPTDGVMKPLSKKIEPRDRVLSDHEIALFWRGCDQIGWPFGRIFQLMLLTGAREGEVAGMQWSELDLENRLWKLPAARVKNGKAHTIHLSDLAMEIITGLPEINRSRLAFTKNGEKPVVNFDYAKYRVCGAMGGHVEPWRPHDLRRTAATGLQRLGISLEVTEAVLNQVSGSRGNIAGVYQRHHYMAERKDALERWGRYIERLIGRDGGNVVVPLRTA